MIDYAMLQTELTTDPNGYGYAPLIAAGNDEQLAALLNQPRATITIRRPNIPAAEVLEAIDTRDFETAPGTLAIAWFESVTQLSRLRLLNDDGTNTRVLGNLRRLLATADTNGSRTRLNAIANRLGSRAEQLFGVDSAVTFTDIAIALRG